MISDARRTGLAGNLHLGLLAFAIASAAIFGSASASLAASKDQQKCINDLVKGAASIAKAQAKADDSCMKAANSGKTSSLGGAGQFLTAQACLGNDVKGKIDKAIGKLTDTEASKCTAEPPTFGAQLDGDVGKTATAASGEVLAHVEDLMGPALDAATLDFPAADSDAIACQNAVVKASGKVIDTAWKLAKSSIKDALKGKNGPAVDTQMDLDAALEADLIADAKGKLGKARTKLEDTAVDRCTGTNVALGSLFRGDCASSGDALALGECASRTAVCRVCRSLLTATDSTLDCDTIDDGVANRSCAGLTASARIITDPSDLIEGPLAHGKLGDYILDNGVARFIIQDVGQRDMYSVGVFGGNIIDAELAGHPGLDNFLEIQPSSNAETIFHATTIEIVNDGTDGNAASIRTCGPDDILDFVNPSVVIEDAGFALPVSADDVDDDVDGCTTYSLEPGATAVQMATEVTNNTGTDVPLFVGDFINAAGEVELWGSTAGAGIGELLTHAGTLNSMSFIGFGDATGVDYSLIPLDDPMSPHGSSFFAVSGVSFMMHSNSIFQVLFGGGPTFVAPASGSKTFTRYFGVGDGTASNSTDLRNELLGTASGRISGCVTIAGVPAPNARVTIGPASGGPLALTGVRSNWTTDASGCYTGLVAEGNYGVAAWAEGTEFEGGGNAPLVHAVTIAEGAPVTQDFDLPDNGTLTVAITDETAGGIPGRVTVVGFDPSPDFGFLNALLGDSGLFRDLNDTLPFGITAMAYADASGNASIDLEAGNYQVYVSRGTEYSLFSAPITITAGATTNVAAQIARVLDTPGFVSSDFHVHGIHSADSRVKHSDRVFQYAGEGVDNIVMTDHHAHTDLGPTIAALGFGAFVTSTIGEEVTTWDTGHYNAYPMTIDPTRPSGGSTDWGVGAPAGTDFASLGSYIMEPFEVEAAILGSPQATVDTTMQINHIDSHFVPLQIDTSAVPPTSTIDGAERLRFRMDPAGGNPFNHFPALELWNGDSRAHQSSFLDERIGIWFNHLNQGLITTFVADTDTHRFTNLGAAGATSWTASSTDDPASISSGEVANSVDAGRLVGGQGIYVQTRLEAVENASLVADFTLGGSTLVEITDPVQGVDLQIDVQAPIWAEFDTIEIYANASTIASPTSPGVAELFSATPTMVLTAPGDFTVSQTNVHAGVPGADVLETSVSVVFDNLTEDTWFVVVVKGTDGVSRPMFPVYPRSITTGSNTTLANLIDGNLNESGTLALGATNALYVSQDGVPGFDAPLAP